MGLVDPSLKRRDYPEVSFAVVGACATGLMGLAANSLLWEVDTFPQLAAIEWVELKHVPILLDYPDSWEESSCTAMFTFAMITGIKNGWLGDTKYVQAARKGWLALVRHIDSNGT